MTLDLSFKNPSFNQKYHLRPSLTQENSSSYIDDVSQPMQVRYSLIRTPTSHLKINDYLSVMTESKKSLIIAAAFIGLFSVGIFSAYKTYHYFTLSKSQNLFEESKNECLAFASLIGAFIPLSLTLGAIVGFLQAVRDKSNYSHPSKQMLEINPFSHFKSKSKKIGLSQEKFNRIFGFNLNLKDEQNRTQTVIEQIESFMTSLKVNDQVKVKIIKEITQSIEIQKLEDEEFLIYLSDLTITFMIHLIIVESDLSDQGLESFELFKMKTLSKIMLFGIVKDVKIQALYSWIDSLEFSKNSEKVLFNINSLVGLLCPHLKLLNDPVYVLKNIINSIEKLKLPYKTKSQIVKELDKSKDIHFFMLSYKTVNLLFNYQAINLEDFEEELNKNLKDPIVSPHSYAETFKKVIAEMRIIFNQNKS